MQYSTSHLCSFHIFSSIKLMVKHQFQQNFSVGARNINSACLCYLQYTGLGIRQELM